MSTNPYAAPTSDGGYNVPPQDTVNAPAIALIVVSSIALMFSVLGIVMNIVVLAVGLAGNIQQPQQFGLSPGVQVALNLGWSTVIFVVDFVILFAGIRMRALRNYPLAMTGAILAVIPCLSPCTCVGIPFGIWALIALSRPGVKDAFR